MKPEPPALEVLIGLCIVWSVLWILLWPIVVFLLIKKAIIARLESKWKLREGLRAARYGWDDE